jgi:Ca2+-binding RTX toxin-like protein
MMRPKKRWIAGGAVYLTALTGAWSVAATGSHNCPETNGSDTCVGHEVRDVIDTLDGDDTITAQNGPDDARGSQARDYVGGDADGDDLNGGPGWDSGNIRGLVGEKGWDDLNGGDGEDDLYSGDGEDTLRGDADNDVLSGVGDGSEPDTLNGGGGYDICAFGTNDTTINCEYP